MLKSFWHDLEKDLEVSSHVSKAEVVSEQLEEACPECGHNLIKRFGKYGSFIGCSGYPECHYMRKIDNVTGESVSVSSTLEIVPDRTCPKDGGVLVIRHGRYGDFISCKNYPKCKFIENILSPDEKLITCPECKTGHIIKRKNRFGKWFYACDNYPECKIIFNYPVLDKVCPSCSYPVLMHKTTKVKGDELVCKQCDYIAPFEHEE
jgi:DNA topoisomerase-1